MTPLGASLHPYKFNKKVSWQNYFSFKPPLSPPSDGHLL